MLTRDIAIFICSRGREDYLTRLVGDIDAAYGPALAAGGLSYVTYVYAQAYAPAYLDGLRGRFAPAIADGRLIIVEAERTHTSIGEVFATAITALHARVEYRLAMLMDDDSLYRADPQVDENLRQAARTFLARGDRAYSLKLGQNRALEYWPFIDRNGPVMPFKEKMLWVSRAVMEEALAFPRFAELSVGEDVVLSALAWRGDATRCFGVFGVATFLHLGFEPDGEVVTPPIPGGYGELVGYVEGVSPPSELGKYEAAFVSGVTPYMVMPDIFVPPDHPHHTFNGIQPAAVQRYDGGGAGFQRQDPHQQSEGAMREPEVDLSQSVWMFERIIRSLKAFEEGLGPNEEAGVRILSAPGDVLRIENVGYWNPDMIKFYGVTGEGHRYELIQHVSQVNLLLVALPKTQAEPRRIGFNLVEQFEKRREAATADS